MDFDWYIMLITFMDSAIISDSIASFNTEGTVIGVSLDLEPLLFYCNYYRHLHQMLIARNH